jgi:hypothetical protein
MTATVAGSFTTAADTAGDGDMQSGVLVIASTVSGNASLTVTGLDSNNKVRLQRSTDNGASWTNQSILNADTINQSTAVTPGHQYRLSVLIMQALKTIAYKMTLES